MTDATISWLHNLGSVFLGGLLGFVGSFLSHRWQIAARREDLLREAYSPWISAMEESVVHVDVFAGIVKVIMGRPRDEETIKAHMDTLVDLSSKASNLLRILGTASAKVLILERDGPFRAEVRQLKATVEHLLTQVGKRGESKFEGDFDNVQKRLATLCENLSSRKNW